MKILLIGASSYVGARLYFDLKFVFTLVGTYSSRWLSKDFVQLDITDKKAVERIILDHKPDVIIHVANNANSRWCEANPDQAVLLNQTATGYIVSAANLIKAKVIYISTMGAIKPTGIYGLTKFESEKLAAETKCGYLILRPSLVLGYSPNTTNDRPFNRLLKNLDEGTPAIYDTTWKFQPTYIGHISSVIQACIEKGIWNQTMTIAVPDLKSRYDTAKDILSPFGITVQSTDAHDSSFATFKDDLSDLKKFDLPQCTYNQMIEKIIDEIKHREKFILS